MPVVSPPFAQLYDNVLDSTIQTDRINQADIRTGIQDMKEVYMPNPEWMSANAVYVANYNESAHRCAYLHKYAACHTGLVYEMLMRSLMDDSTVLTQLTNLENLKICSIGGGPGTDVVAVLYFLSCVFDIQKCSATIVDCMIEWKSTFDTIIWELRTENYGNLSLIVAPYRFEHSYLCADLLGAMPEPVNKAIASANLVTMVKFVSACACQDSRTMIKKIFNCTKPGALILFIDNAAGGFHELVERIADELHFQTVFGPLRHEQYKDEMYSIKRYGYTSLSETKVAVQIWKKVGILTPWNQPTSSHVFPGRPKGNSKSKVTSNSRGKSSQNPAIATISDSVSARNPNLGSTRRPSDYEWYDNITKRYKNFKERRVNVRELPDSFHSNRQSENIPPEDMVSSGRENYRSNRPLRGWRSNSRSRSRNRAILYQPMREPSSNGSDDRNDESENEASEDICCGCVIA